MSMPYTHIEALRVARCATPTLSSTIDGAQPAHRADGAAPARARRDRQRRARKPRGASCEAVERAAALLGMLAVVAHRMRLRAAAARRGGRSGGCATRSPACRPTIALTGLPNRRFFTEWLSYAIAHARRERGHVGVLFIDINGGAAVSEFHGEHATDTLLVEVARRFRGAAREGDLFARLGDTAVRAGDAERARRRASSRCSRSGCATS